MSDYEVTLVNDSSESASFTIFSPLLESTNHFLFAVYVSPLLSWLTSPNRQLLLIVARRQEFYVRFKGPAESMSSVVKGKTARAIR